jgi:hypothetical protein
MCHLLEESFHPSCIEKTKHLHSENQLFLLIPGRKHILFVTLSYTFPMKDNKTLYISKVYEIKDKKTNCLILRFL